MIRQRQITDRASWLEMRRTNVNASDVAALFHAHKFRTALGMWAEKTGRTPPDDDADSAAMRRGRILEPAVAEALREAHPDWQITKAQTYYCDEDIRLGCTPDFFGQCAGGVFLIQAKTVLPDLYEAEWFPAPPAAYLFQVQAEMLLTGISKCVLAVMVLDGREFPVHEFAIPADQDFQAAIRRQVATFWAHVADGREPPAKAGSDGSTLFALHPQHQAEPVLLLHGRSDVVDACAEHERIQQEIKALEARKDVIQQRMMVELRNHQTLEAQDWRVKWTTIPAMQVVQNRKAHRRMTINRIKRG